MQVCTYMYIFYYEEHTIKLTVFYFSVVKSAKIVGATITGASIYTKLIEQLAPKIVIVEEAAEILESGLISAIGSSVQQLIMIGGTYLIVEKYFVT